MIFVREIRLPLNQPVEEAIARAIKVARLSPAEVAQAHLHKLSVDGRHKAPLLVYTIALQLHNGARLAAYKPPSPHVQVVLPQLFVLRPGTQPLGGPVIVCGLGPAGLFAALELAEAGFAPLVLERGPAMAQRRQALQNFEEGGPLDTEANIQFGEGGAGTFSDGKLTSRIRDPLCGRVTQRLLEAGAPAEVGYRAKPHIGTDLLQGVITRLRRQLEERGGRVLFNTKLTGLSLNTQGAVTGVHTTAGPMPCGALVLAVGHSARDTFAMLEQAGAQPQAKDFAVGFRVEHLQSTINSGLYHEAAGHPALPEGEYQLATRLNGRGVYTFCMCPGGSVVAAASEEGGVVTNGMSLHARAGANANAALVAGVSSQDYGPGPFAGVEFQRRLEQAAFAAGGGNYAAPAQTLGSFLEGSASLQLGSVQPTYPRGTTPANLNNLLPAPLAQALGAGIRKFGSMLPGYNSADAVLTGLETRTSSPVRIPRGEELQSTGIGGLWPCGEGAGYAGGIMSAAVDGVRVASAIIQKYTPRE